MKTSLIVKKKRWGSVVVSRLQDGPKQNLYQSHPPIAIPNSMQLFKAMQLHVAAVAAARDPAALQLLTAFD